MRHINPRFSYLLTYLLTYVMRFLFDFIQTYVLFLALAFSGCMNCVIYYTGYRYASASISRLPHLFIGRCPEILRHT